MWKTWRLKVKFNLIIKWYWNVTDLIFSLVATPFSGERVSHSELNQLLALLIFSLVQNWVTVSFSAPEGWRLTQCPCWEPRDVACGKSQEGFTVPALQSVPGLCPLESSKWDMGVLKESLNGVPAGLSPSATSSLIYPWMHKIQIVLVDGQWQVPNPPATHSKLKLWLRLIFLTSLNCNFLPI